MNALIVRLLLTNVLLLPAAALASSTEDVPGVEYWIERMGEALRTENYAGVFTYMRGAQFDTIEVTHRFEGGVEEEKLLLLTGEHREIIRDGDHIICRHGAVQNDELSHDLNHEVPLGPFTHGFNDSLANFQTLYDVSLVGEDRIAGRAAVKLEVTPKQSDRWGYRLWLDKESGLLLQSHLIGRNKVLEVFQFTNVEIGQPIADEKLETTLPEEVASHELMPMRPQVANTQQAKPEWRVSWLPSGFRQVASPRPDRIVFTDGIATFSVFIERRARSEFGTLMGGTAVLSRRIKNSSQQITVVGEVPMDTAKKVAESIEPVIY